MTVSYLLAAIVAAPGLLAGLLVSAGWIVWLAARVSRSQTPCRSGCSCSGGLGYCSGDR